MVEETQDDTLAALRSDELVALPVDHPLTAESRIDFHQLASEDLI